MIIKIAIIAIIATFITSCVKPYSQEIASVISTCGGILIFLLICDEFNEIINYMFSLYSFSGISQDIIKLILKIIGIGYVTEFTADIADDFGNKIISSKVLLGGKIVVCAMSISIIKELLSLLFSFLS